MNSLKQLRGQMRQIAQDLLPEALSKELYAKLEEKIDQKLKKIEEDTKKTMSEMNQRHKETMGYLVRQVSSAPTEKK